MTKRELLAYMAVVCAWWLWENWWRVLLGIGIVVVIVWIGR